MTKSFINDKPLYNHIKSVLLAKSVIKTNPPSTFINKNKKFNKEKNKIKSTITYNFDEVNNVRQTYINVMDVKSRVNSSKPKSCDIKKNLIKYKQNKLPNYEDVEHFRRLNVLNTRVKFFGSKQDRLKKNDPILNPVYFFKNPNDTKISKTIGLEHYDKRLKDIYKKNKSSNKLFKSPGKNSSNINNKLNYNSKIYFKNKQKNIVKKKNTFEKYNNLTSTDFKAYKKRSENNIKLNKGLVSIELLHEDLNSLKHKYNPNPELLIHRYLNEEEKENKISNLIKKSNNLLLGIKNKNTNKKNENTQIVLNSKKINKDNLNEKDSLVMFIKKYKNLIPTCKFSLKDNIIKKDYKNELIKFMFSNRIYSDNDIENLKYLLKNVNKDSVDSNDIEELIKEICIELEK